MKRILIFTALFMVIQASFSQTNVLGRIFPVDTTNTFGGSRIAAQANKIFALNNTGDTLFYNAGLIFLEQNFNSGNLDSLASIADTIMYRYNLGLIYDTVNNVVIDTITQKIGFYWQKAISFNENTISSSITLQTGSNSQSNRGGGNNNVSSTSCYSAIYLSSYGGSHPFQCVETTICQNFSTYCGTSTYTKVFEDDFEGTTLDPVYWNIYNGSPGQETGGPYNIYYSNSDVEVSNGTLKLYAENRAALPSLTCSKIATTARFGYGKFEIMARLPNIYGINPSYWLESATNDLEIDGFEFFTTNQGNMPQMSVYSRETIAYLQSKGCQGNGGNPSNVRVFSETANQPDESGNIFWPSIYDLTDHTKGPYGNGFHLFTLVWDPNYISWIIDDLPGYPYYQAMTWYKIDSDLNSTSNPNYQCSGTTTVYQPEQFPNFTGDVNFLLDNVINPTKNTSGGGHVYYPGYPSSLASIATGNPSTFEIDWVKIYQLDNCGTTVNVPTEYPYLITNHNNQNELTGDIVTLGGAGAVVETNQFWVTPDYNNGTHSILFARANNEVQLLDGFSVDPYTRFEATIAYPGDLNHPSDCDNVNDYFTQFERTSGGNNSFSNSPIISTENQYASNIASNKTLTGLIIYPNPAQNEVNIGGLKTIQQIELLTATMQTIQVISGNQTKIDVSTLAGGLYFLRIYNGDKIIISKFIKQ